MGAGPSEVGIWRLAVLPHLRHLVLTKAQRALISSNWWRV
jgi:hypothetical protein